MRKSTIPEADEHGHHRLRQKAVDRCDDKGSDKGGERDSAEQRKTLPRIMTLQDGTEQNAHRYIVQRDAECE